MLGQSAAASTVPTAPSVTLTDLVMWISPTSQYTVSASIATFPDLSGNGHYMYTITDTGSWTIETVAGGEGWNAVSPSGYFALQGDWAPSYNDQEQNGLTFEYWIYLTPGGTIAKGANLSPVIQSTPRPAFGLISGSKAGFGAEVNDEFDPIWGPYYWPTFRVAEGTTEANNVNSFAEYAPLSGSLFGYGDQPQRNIRDGQWHLYANTVDPVNNLLTMYIDGQLAASNTFTRAGVSGSHWTTPTVFKPFKNQDYASNLSTFESDQIYYGDIRIYFKTLTLAEAKSNWETERVLHGR